MIKTKTILKPIFFARHFHTSKGILSQAANKFSDVKLYDEVPTVKGRTLKNIYQYLKFGAGKSYKIQQDITDEYGPIYKQKIPNLQEEPVVFISNPDDFQKVFSNESKNSYQSRSLKFWSTSELSKKHNLPDSLANLENEEYFRRKNIIKKALLSPKEVAKLNVLYDNITKDLLEIIDDSENSGYNILHDVGDYLKKWSFECAGATTFHTRLNILKKDKSLKTKNAAAELYKSQDGLLENLFKLELINKKFYQTFPSKTWRNFEDSMSKGFKYTKELMDEYGDFVTDKEAGLTVNERLVSCLTVLSAAIDTTSAAALWSLVELSKHPEVQKKICDEVKKVSPDFVVDGKTLQKLTYTRACLKDVFRLNPVAISNYRVLNTDLVLSGYQIPAGTAVIMQTGFVNRLFPVNDSEKFQPERWMKESSCPVGNKPHPFHIVPFGHGTRACIGRRLAENELYTLYANVFRKYKVTRANDDVIDKKSTFLTTANEKVSLKFEERL